MARHWGKKKILLQKSMRGNNSIRISNYQCAVVGEAARDVARHFVQRWNATKVKFPY